MSNFPRELRIFIAEENLDHQDLAIALDVTPTTISNWLRGKRISFAKALSLHDYSHSKISMEVMGY